MTCERIEPLLYLTPDERSVREQQLVERHLRECKHCRILAQKINESLEKIRYITAGKVDVETDGMVSELLWRIENNKHKKGKAEKMKSTTIYTVLPMVKWGFSVAALFFAGVLIVQVLLWNGKQERIASVHPVRSDAKKMIVESIPPHSVITSDNMDRWISLLSLDRSNTLPLEKVVFEKYKKEIMNHAVVRQ